MNIYLFEIKAQIKSFIVWTTAIILLLFALMLGVYPVFYESLSEVIELLKGFPPEFAAAFGFNITDMFSFGGFFSFSLSYIVLVGAIMALSVSVAAFSREKRSKCTDFLLTKPRKRKKIFVAKLFSNITVLLMTNLIFIGASVIFFVNSEQDKELLAKFLLAACSLFFTQLVFMAAGIFFATFAKKVRSVSGVATAVGFGGFILSALANIIEGDEVRFIAPLKYFDATAVFTSGGYEIKYAVTAVSIAIVCIVLAFIKFCSGDAHAV